MMKKRKKVLITLLVFMLLFSSILPVTPLQAEEVTTEEIVEPEVTQEPEITPEPEVTPEPVVPPVTVAKPKSVKLSKTSLTYTGKRIVPTVKAVYDREGKVIASSHYKVIFP